MDRVQKREQVSEIQDRFSRMSSAVLTDFRGLNVTSVTSLRDEFRQLGVDYKVVKNTLMGIAVQDQPYHADLMPYLENPSAVAWSYDDPSVSAKVIVAFQKKNEKLRIKCAVIDGKVIDETGVIALSKMPGKPELLGTLLATFLEPSTGFVRLMAAAPTSFVYLLDARRRKLEEDQ